MPGAGHGDGAEETQPSWGGSGTAPFGQGNEGEKGETAPQTLEPSRGRTGNGAGIHTGICVGRTHPGAGKKCEEERRSREELPWADPSILLPVWGGSDSVKDGRVGSKGKKHWAWEEGA